MQANKIKLYEQRDFGDKINATFTFLRQNFIPLGKSLLYIAGPVVLLVGIISAVTTMDLLFNDGDFSDEEALSFLGGTGLVNVISLFSASIVIAVVYSYFCMYTEREDYENISVSEVWTRTKEHVLPMLLSLIVTGMLIFVGFIFLIIPGFILMGALSFIFILQVKEKLSFGEAFSRCFQLVSDNYLSTIGLILVMIILQAIVGSIFGLPVMLMTGMGAFFSTSSDYDVENSSAVIQALFIIAQVIGSLGSQFLYSIILIAIGYQYGNLVEKKEAAGLMQDIDSLGQQKKHSSEEERY
ncbi:hypothetical protein [Catalinimonas niigatensis]|uniref:hypothetical protein n=1 Tax=Catalinimonas niigatensis TaxID=1397264 RepID=UPI002665DBBA|nr:hypothetical protein [Catalinimonas niigatensis]WPP48100.1 hypothetical protein PZB72_15620 [Catalinimonas niigatensis]